ncbi:MAG TPA: BsuPI-related putative proteinase inhibitor [Bacilli bacterium]|nr:BsuPI-related putative proteinase inhibitor [Bacilli bacterium]
MLIVRTDQEAYRPGEQVRMTLTFCNESAQMRELLFTNAQRFDVVIKRNGEKVWQWSDGRLFAQVMTTLLVAPGDSRVFKAEWPQVDAQGNQVPPGAYEIEAWIVRTEERGETKIELKALVDATTRSEAAAARESAVLAKDPYRMYYGMWALHGYPAHAPLWLRPPLLMRSGRQEAGEVEVEKSEQEE